MVVHVKMVMILPLIVVHVLHLIMAFHHANVHHSLHYTTVSHRIICFLISCAILHCVLDCTTGLCGTVGKRFILLYRVWTRALILAASFIGTCDYQGNCTCPIGTASPTCQTCLADRYNWPTCKCMLSHHLTRTSLDLFECITRALFNSFVIVCRPSIECNNLGTCDNTTGSCKCSGAYTGDDCMSCKPGYYGALCSACPGGASSPCGGDGVGTCNDGRNGDGKCVCVASFRGTICTGIPLVYIIITSAILCIVWSRS